MRARVRVCVFVSIKGGDSVRACVHVCVLVSLPHGAMGSYVIYDCDISLSYIATRFPPFASIPFRKKSG